MLEQQINVINQKFSGLVDFVALTMNDAFESVLTGNVKLAQKVIAGDDSIDKMEVLLEEECLKILALYQPVANDLRFIVSLLKINNDLERIGDLSSNIARRVLGLHDDKVAMSLPFDFEGMSKTVKEMFRFTIEAFFGDTPIDMDYIYENEEKIDILHNQLYQDIKEEIKKNPKYIGAYINYISFSRYLERISDHIVNIAENICYYHKGKIIRHKENVKLSFKNLKKFPKIEELIVESIRGAKMNKKRILFVCRTNSARSQMAEAYMNSIWKHSYTVSSAGIFEASIHPLVIEALSQDGIDISEKRSKTINELLQNGEEFDIVVAVSSRKTAEMCPAFQNTPSQIFWDIPDPEIDDNDEKKSLADVIRVRDLIKNKIKDFVLNDYLNTQLGAYICEKR